MEELRKTVDHALDCSGISMRDFLFVSILGDTLKRISAISSITWVITCVFEVVAMASFDYMEQLKSTLKYIKLVDFPGENVTKFCLKTSYYCKRIDNAVYWDERLLVKLSNIFNSFTEDKFRLWDIANSYKTDK